MTPETRRRARACHAKPNHRGYGFTSANGRCLQLFRKWNLRRNRHEKPCVDTLYCSKFSITLLWLTIKRYVLSSKSRNQTNQPFAPASHPFLSVKRFFCSAHEKRRRPKPTSIRAAWVNSSTSPSNSAVPRSETAYIESCVRIVISCTAAPSIFRFRSCIGIRESHSSKARIIAHFRARFWREARLKLHSSRPCILRLRERGRESL